MESTVSAKGEHRFKLRSYQQEMVDLSLKENIIVAIDTGGGKTAIAVARVEAEIQICDPNKVLRIEHNHPRLLANLSMFLVHLVSRAYCHALSSATQCLPKTAPSISNPPSERQR